MKHNDLVTPKDHCNIVYWSCLLLGTGVLLSYNMLITCADYFAAEFPNYPDIMFYIVPASTMTQVSFLVLMIFYGDKYSFIFRIVTSFISSSAVIGLIPLFVSELSELESFWIVLAVSSFVGITSAVLQSSIIGFCNFLPSSYIQISMAGQAVSGITACIIRIVTKFYDIYGGIDASIGGLIYFVTGAIINAICAICFIYVSQSPFSQYWLKKKDDHDDDDNNGPLMDKYSVSQTNEANNNSLMGAAAGSNENNYNSPKLKYEKSVSYKAVFIKIWRMALAVFLVFYVTLLIFPGLIVGIESQYKVIENDVWMPVILTTEYNVGDFVGRQFFVSWLRKIKWRQENLYKACLFRFLLYPIFIMLFLGYWKYDIIAYVMVALLSISNGYFCCICFIICPGLVKSHEQQVTAAIMSFSLVLGITCGSYTALAVSPFI